MKQWYVWNGLSYQQIEILGCLCTPGHLHILFYSEFWYSA
jgi:hypothetical protein